MAEGESAPVRPPACPSVRLSVLRVLVLVFYSEASCWLRREGNICRQDGGRRGRPSGRHFGGDLLFVNEKRHEVDARRVKRGAVCPCCVSCRSQIIQSPPPPPTPPGENDAFTLRPVCSASGTLTRAFVGILRLAAQRRSRPRKPSPPPEGSVAEPMTSVALRHRLGAPSEKTRNQRLSVKEEEGGGIDSIPG